MTKLKGFKIRVDYFLPIDKKDFTKQAAAYATLAEIKSSGKLPDGFLDQVTVVGIDAKEGSAEFPDAPVPDTDPAPDAEPEIPGTETGSGRRGKQSDTPTE